MMKAIKKDNSVNLFLFMMKRISRPGWSAGSDRGVRSSDGSGLIHGHSEAPGYHPPAFYSFYWHQDIKFADAGNIKAGSLYTDSYAALRTVVQELMGDGKTVIILGGSHDLFLSQYQAYAGK